VKTYYFSFYNNARVINCYYTINKGYGEFGIVTMSQSFPHTFISFARLSRELISRPSLQACKQEITFWVSMRPGLIVRPERLPWKN